MSDFIHVPEGMTEEEVLEVMNKVIDKIAPKWTFFGFTVDDIKQESYFILSAALPKYNGDYPLENFLSVVLPRKLYNLKRDNHALNDLSDDKKKVSRPAQLEDDFNMTYQDGDEYEAMDYSEMVNLINRELPANMRQDYLKMAHQVSVPKPRREEITTYIKIILEDHGYYHEEATSEKG